MEFWGVEVKSGEPFTVQPGEGRVVHLSQANLGETKKDKSNESVCIYVKIAEKKLVLGTLNSEKVPQQAFDIIFDKEFQLSHTSKNGSVFFIGYSALQPFEDESESDDEMYSDEELPQPIPTQGNAVTKAKTQKAVEPKKEVKQDSDDDSDDSDDDEELSSDSDAPLAGEMGSDSDEDDESDNESESDEEETPKVVEQLRITKAVPVKNKKRPNEAASKTPVSDKKAKLATPKKSDGKKGEAHVDTPHPKQAAKNAGNKSNQKSAEGSIKCDSCKRPFKSEFARDAHSKAKHSGGK